MCDRARRFCLTLNNWSEEEYFKLHEHMNTKTFWIIGKEVGESGTPHLQCYVEHKNPMSFKTIKNWNGRLHIEKAKGSRRANYNYCSKDGNFQSNIQEEDLEPEKKEKITELEFLKHYNKHETDDCKDKINLIKYVLENLDILLFSDINMEHKLKNMLSFIKEINNCKACNNLTDIEIELQKVLDKHFDCSAPPTP